jgi:hypothetical protein
MTYRHRWTRIACFSVVVLVAAQGVGCSEERGAMVTAFSASGRRPDAVAYFDTASEALDAWLLAHGFAPSAPVPSGQRAGAGHARGQAERWYRGSHQGSEAFHVLLRRPTQGVAGLQVYVQWSLRAPQTRVATHERKVAEFTHELERWWESYQLDQPQP